jgi:carboxypeptidase C (cathepsin A)
MTNPKRIHYVFFHSQNDLSADPLIVWFTGGPGCSSLLALFHENGPFIFATGKTYFELNDDAWNKKANVLYL